MGRLAHAFAGHRSHNQTVADETGALIDRVHSLLRLRPVDRATIEDTLTEGYGRALALEAERRRLERRITELTGALTGDGDARRISELAELAGRRTSADGELSQLRDVLRALREHLAAARAAQPSSAV
jgi:hypothetical protein